jgi:hypothetical protein
VLYISLLYFLLLGFVSTLFITILKIAYLMIQVVQGDADYKLEGTIASILPMYGKGPMWLEILGLDVYAKTAVLINAVGFIEVPKMNITADFIDIKIHLDNNQGQMGEAINNFLNVLGGYIWDQVTAVSSLYLGRAECVCHYK